MAVMNGHLAVAGCAKCTTDSAHSLPALIGCLVGHGTRGEIHRTLGPPFSGSLYVYEEDHLGPTKVPASNLERGRKRERTDLAPNCVFREGIIRI